MDLKQWYNRIVKMVDKDWNTMLYKVYFIGESPYSNDITLNVYERTFILVLCLYITFLHEALISIIYTLYLYRWYYFPLVDHIHTIPIQVVLFSISRYFGAQLQIGPDGELEQLCWQPPFPTAQVSVSQNRIVKNYT